MKKVTIKYLYAQAGVSGGGPAGWSSLGTADNGKAAPRCAYVSGPEHQNWLKLSMLTYENIKNWSILPYQNRVYLFIFLLK